MILEEQYQELSSEMDHIVFYPPDQPGDLDALLDVLAHVLVRIAKEYSCVVPSN